MLAKTDRKSLLYSATLAAEWLVKVAQKQEINLQGENNRNNLAHENWRGSIRGEYGVAHGQWDYFCAMWHTGQAVKALALLSRLVDEPFLLEGARLGAEFIEMNSIQDPKNPDDGFLFAYEDWGMLVNTSAILETTDGLYKLSEVTGDPKYLEMAARAVNWVFNHQYILGKGLFWELYDPREGTLRDDDATKRPLNDDAQFLRTALVTGDYALREAFYEVCERLLRDEKPPGNWIKYGPCNAHTGAIHPRHAYWWGRPFIDAYRDSGEEKYLQAAIRTGEWYLRAIRHDGGLFRNTYTDFSTDSFGHATSGVACAVLLWNDLYYVTADDRWVKPIQKVLRFCQKMQFTLPRDENLYGCILEKILPFDGSDLNPYHIRDLGTIFYIQAVAEVLQANR